MKHTLVEPADDADGLNRLVYKIKNPSVHEEQEPILKFQENNYNAESAAANIPIIFMKRKQSKPESGIEQPKTLQKTPAHKRVE